MIKVATRNICLGLKNKKETIYKYLHKFNIKICALQEVEINNDYNHELLSSKDYKIETEKASTKARNSTLMHNSIYERKSELKGEDNFIVIVDVNMSTKLRVINVYRSFNPPNNQNPKDAFERQLSTINNAIHLKKIEK